MKGSAFLDYETFFLSGCLRMTCGMQKVLRSVICQGCVVLRKTFFNTQIHHPATKFQFFFVLIELGNLSKYFWLTREFEVNTTQIETIEVKGARQARLHGLYHFFSFVQCVFVLIFLNFVISHLFSTLYPRYSRATWHLALNLDFGLFFECERNFCVKKSVL